MCDTTKELEIFDIADEFIALANKFKNEKNQKLGRVGTALRYAAARFNAYEASNKTDNLEEEKDEALDWFTEQYNIMLLENLEEYIELKKTESVKTR